MAAEMKVGTASSLPNDAPFVTLIDTRKTTVHSAGVATSPVYREGTSPAARLMALPGGVMVKFPPQWAEADIEAWAGRTGNRLGKRLGLSGNWVLVPTPAGQAALDLTLRIQQSGEPVSATPNWWKQTVVR